MSAAHAELLPILRDKHLSAVFKTYLDNSGGAGSVLLLWQDLNDCQTIPDAGYAVFKIRKIWFKFLREGAGMRITLSSKCKAAFENIVCSTNCGRANTAAGVQNALRAAQQEIVAMLSAMHLDDFTSTEEFREAVARNLSCKPPRKTMPQKVGAVRRATLAIFNDIKDRSTMQASLSILSSNKDAVSRHPPPNRTLKMPHRSLLQKILMDTQCCGFFKEFLTRDQHLPELLFWQEAAAFQYAPDESFLRNALRKLFDKYLRPNARMRVELSSELQRELERALHLRRPRSDSTGTDGNTASPPCDISSCRQLLMTAQESVIRGIEDLLPQFHASDEYQNLLGAKKSNSDGGVPTWQEAETVGGVQTLLTDSQGFAHLHKFLARVSTMREKDLLFWQDAENCRRMPSAVDVRLRARMIWMTYLCRNRNPPTGVQSVGDCERQRIAMLLGLPTATTADSHRGPMCIGNSGGSFTTVQRDIFTAAQQSAFNFMQDRCLGRFMFTCLYRDFLDARRNANPQGPSSGDRICEAVEVAAASDKSAVSRSSFEEDDAAARAVAVRPPTTTSTKPLVASPNRRWSFLRRGVTRDAAKHDARPNSAKSRWLEFILNDPIARLYFKEHLAQQPHAAAPCSCRGDETRAAAAVATGGLTNFLFWLDVEDFKCIPLMSQALAMRRRLQEKFIAPGAPMQLQFSDSDARDAAESLLDTVAIETTGGKALIKLQFVALERLRQRVFPAFLRSSHAEDLRAALQERNSRYSPHSTTRRSCDGGDASSASSSGLPWTHIEGLLFDTLGLQHLRDFTVQAGEMPWLQFWLEVEDMKRLPDSLYVATRARRLSTKYFPGAVAVCAETCNAIVRMLDVDSSQAPPVAAPAPPASAPVARSPSTFSPLRRRRESCASARGKTTQDDCLPHDQRIRDLFCEAQQEVFGELARRHLATFMQTAAFAELKQLRHTSTRPRGRDARFSAF